MPSGFALPAFRAGSTIGHRLQRRYEAMANIIDRVAQPLALCAPSGRVLHRNPVLRQMADTDGQKQLLDAVNRVARAVAAAGTPARRRDPAMSATSLAVGPWRVSGSRLELESGRAAPTILVSLLPRASEAGSCKELRARYGLTSRELEVVQLLQLRRSNAEVASALGISEHTARHHTENVLLKLGLHSRTQIDERFAHRALNTDAGASISLA
jgi:DNA-binding CsgD family transcriptional regulator